MPLNLDADLAAILSTGEFAVTATYQPSSGPARTVRGIFDSAYQLADPGAYTGVASAEPAFTCRSSDVSGARQGEALTVNGTTYRIRTPQPDGTGVTVLMLGT